MAALRSAFGSLSDAVVAHPFGVLGLCAAIGILVMWTAARKG
ncbi:MAG: hypothetical protein ACJ798_04485 [Phenylobacterium sp.]